MQLFDEPTLRKLEQLTLIAEAVRAGVMKGERRSHRRGASVTFADYRDYAQGDDLRRLDWNVYARLGRPFIKLTEEEEDLAVHILVDTSSSMDWPPTSASERPADNKLLYAMRLAGGLGHVALASGDLLTVTLFDNRAARPWGPFRSQKNSWRLLSFLEAQVAALTAASEPRQTALDPALRQYALRAGRPGLLFLITDLLSPTGYRDGLHRLSARGYETVLLQLLSRDEADPELSGDLKLIDVETGEATEISLDAATLDAYRERFETRQAEIAAFCGSRGIHHAPVITDLPWDALLLRSLRERGVVG